MSNIKDIRVLNEKAIVVKMPEGTMSYHLWESTMSLKGSKEGDNILFLNDDKTAWVELPEGSWSELGMSDKLTEDQCKKVAETVSGWSSVIYYNYTALGKDYRDIVESAFKNATESVQSLLKSKGIEVPHLILVKNG